jgi:hypothetical protein
MKLDLAVFLGFAAAASVAAGCDTPAGTMCDLVCECEHCSDQDEDARCLQLEKEENVAEVYDCSKEFEALATCFEENGTCDEKAASFTTSELGSCTAKGDFMLDCELDPNVCSTFGNAAFCEGGTCKYTACAGDFGPNPPVCESDSQCPLGKDKCVDAREDLLTCEQDASEVNPRLQQPQPPDQGSSGG